MTDPSPDPGADAVIVEFTAEFTCRDREEADKVTDVLIDAVHEVVCPSDPSLRVVCTNCGGSLVNPEWDGEEPLDPDDEVDRQYLPNGPCWVCMPSDHPGFEQPCVREHHESASLRTRSDRVAGVQKDMDRLTGLLDDLRGGNPAPAITDLETRLRDLADDLEALTWEP